MCHHTLAAADGIPVNKCLIIFIPLSIEVSFLLQQCLIPTHFCAYFMLVLRLHGCVLTCMLLQSSCCSMQCVSASMHCNSASEVCMCNGASEVACNVRAMRSAINTQCALSVSLHN
jgi:hypothetical protein